MLKEVFIFTAGVAIGSCSSYFIFKNRFKKQYEIEAQSEIDHMKEVIVEREKAITVREDEVNRKIEENTEKDIQIRLPKVPGFEKASSEDKKEAENIINYSKYSSSAVKKEGSEDDEDEWDDLNGPIESPKEGLAERPYVISEKEYSNGAYNFHSKEALMYYEDTGYITDEEDIPLEDANYLIGLENLNLFDENENLDRIYIRNERAASDYEIVRIRDE